MGKPHASAATVARRIGEILRILNDGAEWWDVCEFVREKEAEAGSAWELPPDGKPLSDSQIRRYLAKATAMIAESCRASRKKLRRRHLAQRRNLYAKAVSQGDVRTALAVLRDEAELLNLYPARKTQLTGKDGGPVVLHVTEEIIDGRQAPAALENIVEEIVTHDSATDNRPADDPPPSGTEDIPAI